jgi:radical SAM protein with 4Fe4S-binding SPASM domain
MVKLNPKVVVWEYTLKCNSKCIHCGSDCGADSARLREDELSLPECINLVGQIADVGFQRVILSGGEPTLRKDWPKTAERINEKGMEFGIISNALHWDNGTIDRLVSLKPFSVGFSVDGEQETHDYLRGVVGSHKKVFDSIRELKRKGAVVCAVTSVSKKNIDELIKMRNRLIVYEVDAWQIQMASPMGRMKQNMDIVLDEDDYQKLGSFISTSRQKLQYMNISAGDCMGYFGKLEHGLRDSDWDGCKAGIETLGIESDGNIKGCLSIQAKKAAEGNIRNRQLREIWEDEKLFRYTRDFSPEDLKGKCRGCEYGAKCKGGCSSQSSAFFDEYHHAPYCFFRYEVKNGN